MSVVHYFNALSTCFNYKNHYKIYFTQISGQVASYRLYNSPSVGEFYTNLNSTNFVDEIVSTKITGRRESHRIKAVDFNKNLFYSMVAIDKSGNVGSVSNVRGAFMPAPEVDSKLSTKNVNGISALTDASFNGSDVTVTNQRKPEKIIIFLAIGVLSFLVLCIVSVVLIVLVNRRKKTGDDFSSEENSIYGDNDDRVYVNGINNLYETKPSLYDEQVNKHFKIDDIQLKEFVVLVTTVLNIFKIN